MPTVTERHRERAAKWLRSKPYGIADGNDLAALLAEVEAPLQARCATLEAALRGLKNVLGPSAPTCDGCAEEIAEALVRVDTALSGSDSALKPLLVRAASDALHDGCESASEYACASEPERVRWAEAIAERVMREMA